MLKTVQDSPLTFLVSAGVFAYGAWGFVHYVVRPHIANLLG